MVKIEEVTTVTKKQKAPKKAQTQVVVYKQPSQPVVTTTIVQKKSNKKKKRNRNRRRKSSNNSVQMFIDALRYPDLYGPVRLPFPGCFDRTILGMDTAKAVFTGSGTNVVQGVSMNSAYTGGVGQFFTSTAETTAFTAGSSIAAAIQFPPAANVNDCRLNSGCIVVSYTGSALNAAGELILGNMPDLNGSTALTGMTYSALYYQPGTLHVPIASLIDRPLRVNLTQASPQGYNFIPPGSTQNDKGYPYIACSALPASQTITFEIFRNWEIRPTVGTGNAIPYSETDAGRAQDEANLINAFSIVGHLGNQISDVFSDYASSVISSLGSDLPNMAFGVGTAVASFITQRRSQAQFARGFRLANGN